MKILREAAIVGHWLDKHPGVELHSGHYTSPDGFSILKFRARLLTAFNTLRRMRREDWSEVELSALEAIRLLKKNHPKFLEWREGDPEDPRVRFRRFQGLSDDECMQLVFAEARFLTSTDPLFWSEYEHKDFQMYQKQIREELDAQQRAAEFNDI